MIFQYYIIHVLICITSNLSIYQVRFVSSTYPANWWMDAQWKCIINMIRTRWSTYPGRLTESIIFINHSKNEQANFNWKPGLNGWPQYFPSLSSLGSR